MTERERDDVEWLAVDLTDREKEVRALVGQHMSKRLGWTDGDVQDLLSIIDDLRAEVTRLRAVLEAARGVAAVQAQLDNRKLVDSEWWRTAWQALLDAITAADRKEGV